MNFILPVSLTNVNYVHFNSSNFPRFAAHLWNWFKNFLDWDFAAGRRLRRWRFHRSLRNRFRTNRGLRKVGTICTREIGSKAMGRNRLGWISVDYLPVTSSFFSNRTAMIPRYETRLITCFATHDQSCWDHDDNSILNYKCIEVNVRPSEN